MTNSSGHKLMFYLKISLKVWLILTLLSYIYGLLNGIVNF